MADQQVGNTARGTAGGNPQLQFTVRYDISESVRAGAPINLGADGLARHASAASDALTRWPVVALARHGLSFGGFQESGGSLAAQFGSSLELTDPEVGAVNEDGPVFLIGHLYYVSPTAPGLLTATKPSGGDAITPVAIAETTNRLMILIGAPVTST